jgi:hypothetical protein
MDEPRKLLILVGSPKIDTEQSGRVWTAEPTSTEIQTKEG